MRTYQVQKQSGLSIESLNMNFKLSTLKPVHAGWLVSATNAISNDSIMIGWEKSGKSYALHKLHKS